jgi:ubiquinone/menaquinone biosynthesis C-methylase UbiE
MSAERKLLEKNDPWWGEHEHRYNELIPYIQSSDSILDLACGTGYGSDILAAHTKGLVVGGDIAEEAVKECAAMWNRANLKFEVMDGTSLGYSDAYFDKIVSFETIEHTTQYEKMIKEFYRVLKPGGTAFISTPNFPVNSPSGKVVNPYHTQEFTYDEIKSILEAVFPSVKIFGQRYSRYDDGKVNKSGLLIAWFFGIIGIRKLPYGIKNSVSRLFTGKSFYPTAEDYRIVSEKALILRCTTFFCICQK